MRGSVQKKSASYTCGVGADFRGKKKKILTVLDTRRNIATFKLVNTYVSYAKEIFKKKKPSAIGSKG